MTLREDVDRINMTYFEGLNKSLCIEMGADRFALERSVEIQVNLAKTVVKIMKIIHRTVENFPGYLGRVRFSGRRISSSFSRVNKPFSNTISLTPLPVA